MHEGEVLNRILRKLLDEGESRVRNDLFPHIKQLLEDCGIRYVIGGQGKLSKLVIIERGM